MPFISLLQEVVASDVQPSSSDMDSSSAEHWCFPMTRHSSSFPSSPPPTFHLVPGFGFDGIRCSAISLMLMCYPTPPCSVSSVLRSKRLSTTAVLANARMTEDKARCVHTFHHVQTTIPPFLSCALEIKSVLWSAFFGPFSGPPTCFVSHRISHHRSIRPSRNLLSACVFPL